MRNTRTARWRQRRSPARKNKDRPFFIGAAFIGPLSFIAPRKYFDLYPLDRIAPRRIRGLQVRRPLRGLRRRLIGESRTGTTEPPGLLRVDHLSRRERRARPRRTPALAPGDNTIVVFLSDHGYHLGEQGQWMKQTLFERSARAPMIVAGRSTAKGRSTSRIVEFLASILRSRISPASARTRCPGALAGHS